MFLRLNPRKSFKILPNPNSKTLNPNSKNPNSENLIQKKMPFDFLYKVSQLSTSLKHAYYPYI